MDAVKHTLTISKADRFVLLEGLRALPYDYARELAVRIRATECPMCGGAGFAPYVGGDDDETPCFRCHGDGFR